jgi:hypothetical protein
LPFVGINTNKPTTCQVKNSGKNSVNNSGLSEFVADFQIFVLIVQEVLTLSQMCGKDEGSRFSIHGSISSKNWRKSLCQIQH